MMQKLVVGLDIPKYLVFVRRITPEKTLERSGRIVVRHK